jgi:hypothetical protein
LTATATATRFSGKFVHVAVAVNDHVNDHDHVNDYDREESHSRGGEPR